jgi:hypothetical protein
VVSAACRLTSSEELRLLETFASDTRLSLLFNRLNFLRILVHAGQAAAGAKVRRALQGCKGCMRLPRIESPAHGDNDDARSRVAATPQVPLATPRRPQFPCFDAYMDQTCTKEDVKANVSFLSAISYSRPDNMVGMPVLEHLQVRESVLC